MFFNAQSLLIHKTLLTIIVTHNRASFDKLSISISLFYFNHFLPTQQPFDLISNSLQSYCSLSHPHIVEHSEIFSRKQTFQIPPPFQKGERGNEPFSSFVGDASVMMDCSFVNLSRLIKKASASKLLSPLGDSFRGQRCDGFPPIP